MKYTFLTLFFCFYSCSLLANNYHNKLILHGVDIDNPFWEFASKKIAQKEDGAFSELIKKWNGKLNNIWNTLTYRIKKEINATIHQIDFYLDDEKFIEAYLNYYRQQYAEFIDEVEEQEEDPALLNFIFAKLEYAELSKSVKIRTKNIFPLFAATFGTDQKGHYLIINDALYSLEKINNIYESEITHKPEFLIEPGTMLYVSRVIEYSNLFHLIITQSLSSIIHQHDYFAKMLMMLIFNNKTLTQETQKYGIHYTIFQSFLEACLQSKNPFEAAVFVEPFIANLSQEYLLLWREFIEDIENSYNEQDLAAYKAQALAERRAALFKKNNDDENE